MDALKTASDWARAEMLSSSVFALYGILFLVSSFCFWQFGKTDTAKAYVIPMLVAGVLLVILGVGLVISNQMRLSAFPAAHDADMAGFITSEIARAAKTINGYNNAIYIVIPLIIVVSALLLLFLKTPLWQASMIAVIAMMAVILLVDSNANARLIAYKANLQQVDQQK